MWKWIVGTLLSLSIVCIIALYPDDALSPDAQRWLDYQWPQTSQAYLFHLGFDVNQSHDPMTEGKKLLQTIKRAEQQYLETYTEFDYAQYPDDQRISIPEGDMFCQLTSDDCINTLFSSSSPELSEIIINNQVLLQRYKQLIQLTDYSTLTTPTVMEPFPKFRAYLQATRLRLLEHIMHAEQASPEEAIDHIVEEIHALRHQMSKADHLLSKMVSINQVADYLQVLAIILNKYHLTLPTQIPELTEDERSLELPMMREFIANYHIFQQVSVNPGDDFRAPSWALHFVYKPNMSANSAYLDFAHIAEQSKLDSIQFTQITNNLNAYPEKPTSIRNVVGAILINIASPQFQTYLGRFHDLNCRIVLLNTLTNDPESTDIATIANPYFGESKPATLSNDQKSICFDGPLEDTRNLRCLRIKL